MSSTNKTTNLKLNDWVGTDVPQREDFNADNQRIDKAIGDHTGNTTVHITQAERCPVKDGIRHRVCVQRIPGAPAARQMGIEKGWNPVPQQATQIGPPGGRDHQFQIAVRAMISCVRAAQIAECLLKAL